MTRPEYIAILFADCGFERSSERQDWLQRNFGKRYADELDKAEAHEAIEMLKEMKLGRGEI